MAIHAPTAGLLDVLLVDFGDSAGDRFTVGNTGRTHVGLDAKLAQHPVDQDVEVQLAHARDDGLPGILIGADAECGIFLG